MRGPISIPATCFIDERSLRDHIVHLCQNFINERGCRVTCILAEVKQLDVEEPISDSIHFRDICNDSPGLFQEESLHPNVKADKNSCILHADSENPSQI